MSTADAQIRTQLGSVMVSSFSDLDMFPPPRGLNANGSTTIANNRNNNQATKLNESKPSQANKTSTPPNQKNQQKKTSQPTNQRLEQLQQHVPRATPNRRPATARSPSRALCAPWLPVLGGRNPLRHHPRDPQMSRFPWKYQQALGVAWIQSGAKWISSHPQ